MLLVYYLSYFNGEKQVKKVIFKRREIGRKIFRVCHEKVQLF